MRASGESNLLSLALVLKVGIRHSPEEWAMRGQAENGQIQGEATRCGGQFLIDARSLLADGRVRFGSSEPFRVERALSDVKDKAE